MKRKTKKTFKRFGRFLLIIFLIIGSLFYLNQNIIFKPFLRIKGNEESVNSLQKWINLNYSSFIVKKVINNLSLIEIDNSIASIRLQKKYFLFWELNIENKISYYYIAINNQIRALDHNFNLLDLPVNQLEIQKQVPFILKIEILDKIPKKVNLKNKESRILITDPNNTEELINKNTQSTTELDIFKIYKKDIQPFINYLYKSESSLGPKLTLLQSFPNEGLRFYLYERIYWIGFLDEFKQIEKNIDLCESYLKKKNKLNLYNEIDLRYKNQIICRNNQ